jgi:hypothetical protein
MQQPTLNGVMKPADVIAKGPHVYNPATRKYEEKTPIFSEYPRGMWHQTLGYKDVLSLDEQKKLQAEGWRTSPFPAPAVAKETVVAPAADLALIVLQQQQMLASMQKKLEEMNEPNTTPAIPEEAKRGPGRPRKEENAVTS